MKGGPCYKSFSLWQACVGENTENNQFTEQCKDLTEKLQECILSNQDYYGALLKEGILKREEEGDEELGNEGDIQDDLYDQENEEIDQDQEEIDQNQEEIDQNQEEIDQDQEENSREDYKVIGQEIHLVEQVENKAIAEENSITAQTALQDENVEATV